MNKIWEDLPATLRKNPFFQFSAKTDFVPAWDKIKMRHVLPAFNYAFAMVENNIRKIIESPAKPTFRNTIEPLNQAQELITYFLNILNNLAPHSRAEEKKLTNLRNNLIKKFTKIDSAIYSENSALYKRFMAARKDASFKELSHERKMIADITRESFRNHGYHLSAEKRDQLKKIKKKIDNLEFQIQNNMDMAERERLIVGDPARLQGLPPFLLDAGLLKSSAWRSRHQWIFDLNPGKYDIFMSFAEDRDLRRQLWEMNAKKGAHGKYDNRAKILDLVKLNERQAWLLGHKNAATLDLSGNKVDKPEKIFKFARTLRRSALPAARIERKVLLDYAWRKDGIKLQPWDERFYTQQIKKKTLGFTDNDLRRYFELENVLKGTFRHFEKLLGIRFVENNKYPVYDKNVRTYEAYHNKSGKKLGVLVTDLLDRPTKSAGIAWDGNILDQGLFQGKVRRPVNVVNLKIPQGKNGQPTLLRHEDVLVLFHELGHATHHFLSKCRYNDISGTNVESDFVEFLSTIQENWAYEPEVLADFAVDYKTGKKMPSDLLQSLHDSRKFMAGTYILNAAAKGALDLAWHSVPTKKITSVEAFEKAVLKPYRLSSQRQPLYSTSFDHIFGGGYDSNFCGYKLCEVEAADAFGPFMRQGLYNKKLAAAYRKIPESGGSKSGTALFRAFRHRATREKDFLLQNGLLGEKFNYSAALDSLVEKRTLPLTPAPLLRAA